jgi:hypothetical protein
MYGCNENEPVIKPSNIFIEGIPSTAYVGEEYQLSAHFDIESEGRPEWSVEDEKIASIDENGKLKTLCEGKTRVVAKYDNLVKSAQLKVLNDFIVFDTEKIAIVKGSRSDVDVVIKLNSERNVNFEWSSSNRDIFTIGGYGTINGKFFCTLDGKNVGEAYLVASYKSFCDSCLVVVENPTGSENGRDWVHMGLSVKWATMNVGASAISEDGICVAWGETAPKHVYNWESYKWCVRGPYIADGTYHDTYLSKYQLDDNSGPYYRIDTIRTQEGDFTKEEYEKVFIGDGKCVLDPEDDAAHVKWGGNWRMPTYDECKELIDNCTWEEVLYDGVYGYKATSKITNQWLFFPATRHKEGYESVGGRHSFVWSSKSTLNAHAAYLSLSNGKYKVDTYYSAIGCYVRGVVE